MNAPQKQQSDIQQSSVSEIKQRLLQDQVLLQLLNNYSEMDDEELAKKYTLLISSKKYKNLKIKMANSSWNAAYL